MNGVNDESDGEQHVEEVEEQEESVDAMSAQGIIAGKRKANTKAKYRGMYENVRSIHGGKVSAFPPQ